MLADDDASFRHLMTNLVEPETDLQLVGEVTETDKVVGAIQQQQPDIVLLSLTPGVLNGFQILEQLYPVKLSTRIIGLAESENQAEYVRAVRLGCRGILLKTVSSPLMLKSVRKVFEGELWLDRITTAEVLRQFTQEQVNGPRLRERDRDQKTTPLSPREKEIVGLVMQGYKNKELAEKLVISEQTVKNHMHNIFDKLGVSDRLELALYAIHNRLHE